MCGCWKRAAASRGITVRDAIGRDIDYIRVSITDRCNLRCLYCMPEEGVSKLRHKDILSFEQIGRICRVLAGLGVRKAKITGGEPLVRKGAASLVELLKKIPGIDVVTMTTNGILLSDQVETLKRAGLDGINISLDTLNPGLYRELTRGGDVTVAVRGLDSALHAGIDTVKVNCVPLAGVEDQGLLALAALARERPVHVRFIEVMPIGLGKLFQPLGLDKLRAMLENAYGALQPCGAPPGNGPARYYSLPGFAGSIGFIETLDQDICSRCNRLRLTADGRLKTCLHMDSGIDLWPVLALDDESVLEKTLIEAIQNKPEHHCFGVRGESPPEGRTMSQIGG